MPVATLDAQVLIGGVDRTNSLSKITRDARLCRVGQGVTLEFDRTLTLTDTGGKASGELTRLSVMGTPTAILNSVDGGGGAASGGVDVWDDLVVYEQGTLVLTGYVEAVTAERAPAKISILGRDKYKRATGWFITEVITTNGETVSVWVDYLCNLCGLPYATPLPSSGSIQTNTEMELGLRTVDDSLGVLCGYVGWTMRVRPTGVLEFIETSGSYGAVTLLNVMVGKAELSDKDTRNAVKIWGYDPDSGQALTLTDRREVSGVSPDRIMVVASPHIQAAATAQTLATRLLNHFAGLTLQATVDLIGDATLQVGQQATVDAWDDMDVDPVTDTITELHSEFGSEGYRHSVVLARRCYRLPGVYPVQQKSGFSFVYPLYIATTLQIGRSNNFYVSDVSYENAEGAMAHTYADLCLDPFHQTDRAWAIGTDGIYQTLNLGATPPTWTQKKSIASIKTDLSVSTVVLHRIEPSRFLDGSVYVLIKTNSTTWRVMHTHDSGSSWTYTTVLVAPSESSLAALEVSPLDQNISYVGVPGANVNDASTLLPYERGYSSAYNANVFVTYSPQNKYMYVPFGSWKRNSPYDTPNYQTGVDIVNLSGSVIQTVDLADQFQHARLGDTGGDLIQFRGAGLFSTGSGDDILIGYNQFYYTHPTFFTKALQEQGYLVFSTASNTITRRIKLYPDIDPTSFPDGAIFDVPVQIEGSNNGIFAFYSTPYNPVKFCIMDVAAETITVTTLPFSLSNPIFGLYAYNPDDSRIYVGANSSSSGSPACCIVSYPSGVVLNTISIPSDPLPDADLLANLVYHHGNKYIYAALPSKYSRIPSGGSAFEVVGSPNTSFNVYPSIYCGWNGSVYLFDQIDGGPDVEDTPRWRRIDGYNQFSSLFSTGSPTGLIPGSAFIGQFGHVFLVTSLPARVNVYKITPGGKANVLYRSTDGGHSYSSLSSFSQANYFNDILVDYNLNPTGSHLAVSQGGRVFVSTSSGSSWTDVTPLGATAASPYPYTLETYWGGKNFMAYQDSNNLWYTSDRGVTWARRSTFAPSRALNMSRTNQNRLIRLRDRASSGLAGDIFLSNNGGVDWTDKTDSWGGTLGAFDYGVAVAPLDSYNAG